MTRFSAAASLQLLSLLLPLGTYAAWDGIAIDDKITFDFTPLKGQHSVVHTAASVSKVINTTWTIDPAAPIPKVKGKPDNEQCPFGTQICGVEREYDLNGNPPNVTLNGVITVAGDFPNNHINHKFTRLKKSSSHSGQGKEGIRVELHGGTYKDKKQTAIIEFICDPNKTGLEGEAEDKKTEKKAASAVAAATATSAATAVHIKGRPVTRRDQVQKKDDEKKDDEKKPEQSLKFENYDGETLRLTWYTKYACESNAGKTDPSKAGWGLFTWIIIVGFLGIAAYLIFGSWLNYNRYGARGWDLLPHNDTIRDLPYLLRDFARRVVNTFQHGGGSGRGGYSAI